MTVALADLDKSRDEIVIVDAGTLRIRHVSGAALERLGYTRDEVEGCDVSVIGPEYPRELLPAPHGAGDNGQRERRILIEHRARDGSQFLMRAHIRIHRVQQCLNFVISAVLA